MPEKTTVFKLTKAEKNQISSIAELAIRSDEKKAEKKWGDLHSVIEKIILEAKKEIDKDWAAKLGHLEKDE